ncbi:branched-chain amino acid transport system substrate-binding protein [Rhodoligotrophos appendicifer]|uniref:ABC transporter substrate-binding protein n=1 Tax=Rhodoligotrophos appendicifer TaxID=987056 RepID=UPI00147807DA|nr:ABC transporter substrate-binding protein [Rhodoligotrophos appendicifer]
MSLKKFGLAKAVLISALFAYAVPALAQQGVSDDKVTIGMHSSLSGPVAVFGLAYQRAAQLAIDEANAAGGVNGRQVELIVEDDRGDPGAGVAAVTKLMNRDEVFLIYGGPYTPVALAAYPRVVENDMIYWSPASSTPGLTVPFQPLTFQAQLTLDDQAIPVAKLAASMKPTKIAFIAERSEYGTITHEATVEQLKKYGLDISLDLTIEPDALSAGTQIAQIKDAGVDLIIHGGTPKALAFIIREIHKQQVNIPMLSFGGGSSAAIIELVTGEAPIEYYAVSPLACALGTDCTKEFIGKWQAKFGSEKPIVWAAQGYAATKYFLAGLKAAGKDLTNETLTEAFEGMEPFPAVEMPYPFKVTAESHRAVKGGYLEGYKGGKQVFFGDEMK